MFCQQSPHMGKHWLVESCGQNCINLPVIISIATVLPAILPWAAVKEWRVRGGEKKPQPRLYLKTSYIPTWNHGFDSTCGIWLTCVKYQLLSDGVLAPISDIPFLWNYYTWRASSSCSRLIHLTTESTSQAPFWHEPIIHHLLVRTVFADKAPLLEKAQ